MAHATAHTIADAFAEVFAKEPAPMVPLRMKLKPTIADLEEKRKRLHDYVIMKLDEQDYHGVADAAMDLREIDAMVAILEANGEK